MKSRCHDLVYFQSLQWHPPLGMLTLWAGMIETGFLMTMVMTTIHKSSFEGEVDQWLTMVDRIIVYKVTVPSKYSI